MRALSFTSTARQVPRVSAGEASAFQAGVRGFGPDTDCQFVFLGQRFSTFLALPPLPAIQDMISELLHPPMKFQ